MVWYVWVVGFEVGFGFVLFVLGRCVVVGFFVCYLFCVDDGFCVVCVFGLWWVCFYCVCVFLF